MRVPNYQQQAFNADVFMSRCYQKADALGFTRIGNSFTAPNAEAYKEFHNWYEANKYKSPDEYEV